MSKAEAIIFLRKVDVTEKNRKLENIQIYYHI